MKRVLAIFITAAALAATTSPAFACCGRCRQQTEQCPNPGRPGPRMGPRNGTGPRAQNGTCPLLQQKDGATQAPSGQSQTTPAPAPSK